MVIDIQKKVAARKHAMNPSGVYPLAAGYWDGWELDYRET
jgi:hypothetical protein